MSALEVPEGVQPVDWYSCNDPVFARTGKGTKVHVIDPWGEVKPWLDEHEFSWGEALIRMIVGRSYCGEVITGLHGGHTLDTFLDRDLCVRCQRCFPMAPERLYQHPQPLAD